MNFQRKKRLWVILSVGIVLSMVAALVLYALRQNISLFYTPTDVAEGKAPFNHTIRLGGMVVEKTVNRDPDSLKVTFVLTDYKNKVTVQYNGILPDLFREGQGIVTKGVLSDNNVFTAGEVLAKHDENYMPPEVKASLTGQKRVTNGG